MCPEDYCPEIQAFSLQNSTKGLVEDMSIAIQSNPVRDILYLKTEGNYQGQFEVQVYNMTGSLVFYSQLTRVMPLEYHEIDFQARLNPGIYILTCLYNGKRTLPVKMIVY